MNACGSHVQPVVGLEIHVQLLTRTKLYCGCKVEFGAPPNSRVCPVCLGLPGALPVINRHAISLAARMAAALRCEIAPTTRWDRKSYYYPDLPKNYQISQHDQPVARRGVFAFDHDGQRREVRIRRLHLEEDAGKNLHELPAVTEVDLNRAGTPLMEIVTEPDLHGAQEAYAFCTSVHTLATYLGVTEGIMQKGQMRFEPNINLRITEGDRRHLTPICEVKNLNSFRAIRRAIDYEIDRQAKTWQQDRHYTLQEVGRENRGWDDSRNITVYQRSKEEAHDYRYFPDADLVPVIHEAGWLQTIESEVPELPADRRDRLIEQHGLERADAAQIVGDLPTADLFDAAVACGAEAGVLAKHFANTWARHANSRNTTIAGLGIDAGRIAELATLVIGGAINATAASVIAGKMLDCAEPPSKIAKACGLEQMRDRSAVEALVEQVIADNVEAAEMVRKRAKKWEKSLGFLQGQVMRRSQGRADPRLVREVLETRFD